MRKSSFGTSGHRPGVLKPRNDHTPINRRSSGQHSLRKSHIPKTAINQPDRGSTKIKRPSAEGLSRLSLAGGRYTPTRNNVPSSSNHLAAPSSSSNRMSFDSTRGSSIGGKMRKDTRPISDPNFKSRCVDKIFDFLISRNYDHPIQRRTLLTPSTKDFVNIFTFIYRNFDSSFTMPSRFEEEIPRLLKLMKYPIQMPKSSFITVGSPHTWASVLAMLTWLVDCITMFETIDPVSTSFPQDFETDINIAQLKFETLVKVVRCEDREEEVQMHLQHYSHEMERTERVRQQDIIELQEEKEALEEELVSLNSGPERLQQLQHQNAQILSDTEKMTDYCRGLQVCLATKNNEKDQLAVNLAERKSDLEKVYEEVTRLENLKAQQALSPNDLMHFKNHANEVATEVSQLQTQGKDLDSQIWSSEMELGKVQRTMSEDMRSYNTLVRKLDQSEDYEISMSMVTDNLHHWKNSLQNDLRVLKKNAKQVAFQTESEKIRKEEELNTVTEMLKDKKDENNRMESKLRRLEDDISLTKKEIDAKDQEMQQESERLHQLLVEARQTHKSSRYQKQCALDRAKEELEETKRKGRERIRAGTDFLVKVCSASLEHVQFQENESAKYKKEREKTCKEMTDSIE